MYPLDQDKYKYFSSEKFLLLGNLSNPCQLRILIFQTQIQKSAERFSIKPNLSENQLYLTMFAVPQRFRVINCIKDQSQISEKLIKGLMRNVYLLFLLLFYFFFHQFAQQITGMRFCEASAKDNFNVDEIFLKLVDDILKKVKY